MGEVLEIRQIVSLPSEEYTSTMHQDSQTLYLVESKKYVVPYYKGLPAQNLDSGIFIDSHLSVKDYILYYTVGTTPYAILDGSLQKVSILNSQVVFTTRKGQMVYLSQIPEEDLKKIISDSEYVMDLVPSWEGFT